MNQSNRIYITPDEAKAIQMGLGLILQNIKDCNDLPWNTESRKDLKNILTHSRSASVKIEKFTGINSELPPYVEGEEFNYFTKES